MQVQVKYFYTGSTEMKQNDLVYVMGFVEDENRTYEGLYKIAFITSDNSIVFYPLGHTSDTYDKVEMYFEHIEKLVKVNSKEIDEAIDKILKRL